MSLPDEHGTGHLGLRRRFWRSISVPRSGDRFSFRTALSLSRRRQREVSSSPGMKMRPGPDLTSDIELPSTSLYMDATKINPAEWYPRYRNCARHFLNVAQHTPFAQSLAAFVNISLPCQRITEPVLRFSDPGDSHESDYGSAAHLRYGAVSLLPYIRRLIVTATDTPAVLNELFGDEWQLGVGPLHSQERINYLFAAKSGGWLETKRQYDILPDESVPFFKPLRDPREEEIRIAEAHWSEWLAMEDWMVGPRSPFEM